MSYTAPNEPRPQHNAMMSRNGNTFVSGPGFAAHARPTSGVLRVTFSVGTNAFASGEHEAQAMLLCIHFGCHGHKLNKSQAPSLKGIERRNGKHRTSADERHASVEEMIEGRTRTLP
jgi:hypothetical protein